MLSDVQAVNADEFERIIGKRPFVALPQEEIDRLYGAIEVFPVNRNEGDGTDDDIRLSLFVVAHYNYTWMTCIQKGTDSLSLGFSSRLLSKPGGDIFLCESITTEAKKVFDENVRANGMYDVRIAGLVYDESSAGSQTHLGITCICRLRQTFQAKPGNDDLEIGIMGNGELLQKQHRFDKWSRIVIDHIVAM